MRPTSDPRLIQCVKDFLDNVDRLPNWIVSSTLERAGRGHYEWVNWSRALTALNLWTLSGPWPVMVFDIKTANLIGTVGDFHKVKDQLVWEIVEQTYRKAERARNSPAGDETVKTRIRSVFSWQRRHDRKKYSLMWFIDLAFVLAAYSEYQSKMMFSTPVLYPNAENIVPELSAADFGIHAARLEEEMISRNVLPFYGRVKNLRDEEVLMTRRMAGRFCQDLDPPYVDMDGEVQGTRGMPREEKAVDFMTPWLESMEERRHSERWNSLIEEILGHWSSNGNSVMNVEGFLTELCRVIVYTVIMQHSTSDLPEVGYVYDIAATTAVEQSERVLLVSLRLPGHRRKKTVSRRTLRGDLDRRMQQRQGSVSPSASGAESTSRRFEAGPS